MTSNRPDTCCYKGFKHEGEATGQMEQWGDFEVYVKYPENKSTERAILFLTDVIGHRSINSQLLADQFAANGYFVVMPDLFYGDAIELNQLGELDIPKWFGGGYSARGIGHDASIVDPIVETCLSQMRLKHHCKKIGAVGYCFGAKYVVRFLRPDQAKIDVGYGAHPSQIARDELQAIKGPFAIAAAAHDHVFPPEKRHERHPQNRPWFAFLAITCDDRNCQNLVGDALKAISDKAWITTEERSSAIGKMVDVIMEAPEE
ncbi:hypothetical protein AYO20_04607 [Fonsecaea nubica]|uniref:Dienelactone hydrolase domain-containing protein n=1 Tax=Fonsecaea nubica TaxID=856822 RepID=A0A178D4A6_9EURO|nr:hypothetical protein AYO20_04607 [Fonsecaea nubica]OAL36193.1 hypothetical protein AYO20_04607 [Fonsecaea nubica]